jgi:hypothetical protein
MLFASANEQQRSVARAAQEASVTAHPRHKTTRQNSSSEGDAAEGLQGEYGSGGSYGVGGGFADDEPGSKAPQPRESAPDLGAELVRDVHTRESEENDETLRRARRAEQERAASDGKRPLKR